MEFLTVLLLLVGPEIVLSTSLYSAIVADHQNRCPPRDKNCLPEGEDYQNDTTDCCGYCNCDLTKCSKYGTCCLKAYGSIEEARESIPHTLYKCVNPNVYKYDERHNSNRNQLIGYQLISVCNSSSPDPTIRDLCENPDVDTYLDTLFPVTDHSSKLVYRNQYCALCDEYADLEKISQWVMDIECDKAMALTHERMYHVIKEHQCNVTFEAPPKITVEKCIPYTISTCNETGLWRVYNETLDTACQIFVDPFNFTYKNVFCFLCNIDARDPVSLSNCPRFNMSLGSVSAFNPPFLAIMNLGAILTEQGNEQIQCKEQSQFTDDKLGVCRDIHCDPTHYMSFEGNCDLNPEYKNPECYILLFKITPLDFRLTISYLRSFQTFFSSLNATDVEMFYKEIDTDKGSVEYFVIKVLTEYLSYAKEAITMLQMLETVFGFDMRIELGSYNVSLYNSKIRMEASNINTASEDVLKKLKLDFPKDTESCVDKDIVYVDHLIACPFVQLKLKELNMHFINGSLFFLDTYNMSLPPLKYRIENESILICISDYEAIYEKLPVMVGNKGIAPRFFSEISAKNLLSLLCVCVSIVSILITIVMFIVTPSLHSHPGLDTLILCVFLLLAQTFYQFGVGQVSLPHWACSMIGAICHLLWLCVMVAMHVCSLDMFLIFRKLEQMKFESLHKKAVKRIGYILTLSLLFVVINIIVSLSKSGGEDVGYGGIICYISSSLMQIVTFVIPSVLAIVTNIGLFIFVAIHIKKSSIQNAGLKQERNYFEIYARLSTLTGFTWIVGFLLLIIPNEVLEYMFILLNASQGLFVMVAFIFNKRVWMSCRGKRPVRGSTRSESRSTRITSVTD